MNLFLHNNNKMISDFTACIYKYAVQYIDFLFYLSDTRRKIGSKFERVAPLSELTSEPSRQPGVSPTPDTRPMQGVCPVALRQQMTGGVPTSCHCHLPGVPSLMDVEFDVYVQKCVPVGQVLVVAIVSSA